MNTEATNDERELSLTEAANRLGRTRQRVHQLAVSGRMGRRIGHQWVFTVTEVDRVKQELAELPKGGRRPEKRPDPR